MQSSDGRVVTVFPGATQSGVPFLYQTNVSTIVACAVEPEKNIASDAIQVQETSSSTVATDDQTGSNGSESEPPEPREIEKWKQDILNHPMTPLLTLLLERCEQATRSSASPTLDVYDQEIKTFISQNEQNGKSLYTDDTEVDDLMIQAIQVLRIHLMEIEKVGELCKDFCVRYQARLKTTLQNEQLVHVNIEGMDEEFDSPPPSTQSSSSTASSYQGQLFTPAVAAVPQQMVAQMNGNNILIQGDFVQPAAAAASVMTLGQGQVVSGGTVYQMVQTPQGLVAQPICIQPQMINPTVMPLIHNSTGMSQFGLVGASSAMNDVHQTNIFGQTLVNCQPVVTFGGSTTTTAEDEEEQKRLKRGVLPKRATQVMRSWLFQHIAHPYPTEDEKRQIAAQTNLSLLQVNNWFINGRRRILQPMLDGAAAATTTDASKTAKKNKSSSRSAKRFWPENIANLKSTVTQYNNSSDMNSSDGEEEMMEEAEGDDVEEEYEEREESTQDVDHISSDSLSDRGGRVSEFVEQTMEDAQQTSIDGL